MSPEEAARESSYSHGGLRRLVRNGHIRTTTRHGIVYFSAEDIEKLKAPEGFLALKEAVKQSEFSVWQIKYRVKTGRIRTAKRGGKLYVSAEGLGIHVEKQDGTAGPKADLEKRIGDPI